MPKARKGKRTPVARRAPIEERPIAPVPAAAPNVRRPASGPQSLLTPASVALGCWGFGAYFFFFSPDPNHLLYGGFAVLMALMWSYILIARARKVYALRQRT